MNRREHLHLCLTTYISIIKTYFSSPSFLKISIILISPSSVSFTSSRKRIISFSFHELPIHILSPRKHYGFLSDLSVNRKTPKMELICSLKTLSYSIGHHTKISTYNAHYVHRCGPDGYHVESNNGNKYSSASP